MTNRNDLESIIRKKFLSEDVLGMSQAFPLSEDNRQDFFEQVSSFLTPLYSSYSTYKAQNLELAEQQGIDTLELENQLDSHPFSNYLMEQDRVYRLLSLKAEQVGIENVTLEDKFEATKHVFKTAEDYVSHLATGIEGISSILDGQLQLMHQSNAPKEQIKQYEQQVGMVMSVYTSILLQDTMGIYNISKQELDSLVKKYSSSEVSEYSNAA